ncbi:MAG: NUDIX domain-containing protein [bacterium]|nr:NUDIX domain-containing protein [bacterium]
MKRTTPTSVPVAAFIEKDEKLLFVRQAEAKGGGWGPPAGHIKLGESIVQAIRRETREETGLEIELVDLVGIYTVQEPERLKVGFVFRGKMTGGELRPVTKEAAELRWLTREELQSIVENNLLYKPEYNRRGIVDYFAGESYPLTLLKESP